MTGDRAGRWAAVAQGSTLPRAALAVGIAATVAFNITAGIREGRVGGAVVAALIPVALLISLESAIWLARTLGWKNWRWVWQIAADLPLLGLAGITGVVSYLHALNVSRWTGSSGLSVYLIPLTADLLILTGSVALMALAVTRPAAATSTVLTVARDKLDAAIVAMVATTAAGNPYSARALETNFGLPRKAATTLRTQVLASMNGHAPDVQPETEIVR